tara:strand:+ start:273 stop:551 length:279 start_codon:yes stop_codon:yes gene_type:complete
MPIIEVIEFKLNEKFSPHTLEVEDQSALHAGHAGASPGGETHFHIILVSKVFLNKTRLERQRMVHNILHDEIAKQIHALGLSLFTPEEFSKR